MKPSDGEQVQCPCCNKCKDCKTGFQKVLNLQNAGLVIYRHTTHTDDVNKNTGITEVAIKPTEDVFILHNTKDVEITSADYLPEIEQNKITCPRCLRIIEHAQKLLQKGPNINKNDVIGICEHCRTKEASCFECKEVVRKFVASKNERADGIKERVKEWLSKIKHLLKDAVTDTEIGKERVRARSELYIDQLCRDDLKPEREPEVKQMFHPATDKSDFFGAFPPSIEKRKEMFRHFTQIKSKNKSDIMKMKSPVVVIDSPGKVEKPSTSKPKRGVYVTDREKVYGLDVDREDIRAIHSPLSEEETQKENHVELKEMDYIPPVPFQSEEDFIKGKDRKITEFSEILTPMLLKSRYKYGDKSYAGTKPHIKTAKHRHVSDVTEPYQVAHLKRKYSLESSEAVKGVLRKTDEVPNIIQQYHSDEALLTTIAGVTRSSMIQGFRFFFPKIQSPDRTLKRQKSSSELIKDTQDMLLTRAEEDKKRLEKERKEKIEEDEKKIIAQKERRKQLEAKIKVDEEKNRPEQLEKKEEKDKPKKNKVTPTVSTTTTTSKSKSNDSHLAPEKKEIKSKEKRDPKEPKEPKEPKDPKEPIKLKKPKEPKDPNESKEQKVPKVPKESKEQKDLERPKEPKKPKEPTELKESKEPKSVKEPKESNKPKEVKHLKEPEPPKEPIPLKKPKETKVDKNTLKADKDAEKAKTKQEQKENEELFKEEKEEKVKFKKDKEEQLRKSPAPQRNETKPKDTKEPKEFQEPNKPNKPKEVKQKEPNVDKDALKTNKSASKIDKEALKADKDALKADKEALKADKDALKANKDAIKADKDAEKAQKEQDKKDKEKLKKEKEEQLQNEKEMKKIENEMKQKEKDNIKREKDELQREKGQIASKLKENKEKDETEKRAREEAKVQLKKVKEAEVEPKSEPEKPKVAKQVEQPHTKDLNVKSIKLRAPSPDDLILQLVKLKQSTGGERIRPKRLSDVNLTVIEVKNHRKYHKRNKINDCLMCLDSDIELDAESLGIVKDDAGMADIIIGPKIFTYKPPLIDNRNQDDDLTKTLFFQSLFDDTIAPVQAVQAVQVEQKPPVTVGKPAQGKYVSILRRVRSNNLLARTFQHLWRYKKLNNNNAKVQ